MPVPPSPSKGPDARVAQPLRPESGEHGVTTTQASSPPSVPKQTNNPLHGVTLAAMVTALSEFYGWDELGQRINIRCFTHDPSVPSSLKFLRKTPWAREKVEGLYLYMLRDQRRRGGKSP